MKKITKDTILKKGKSEIIKGNKLNISKQEMDLIREFMGKDFYKGILLKYIDWNILMPIIEKISKIHYGWEDIEAPYQDCAYPRIFGMQNNEGRYMFRFNANQLFIADTLIEACWLAVVDFVNEINKKK